MKILVDVGSILLLTFVLAAKSKNTKDIRLFVINATITDITKAVTDKVYTCEDIIKNVLERIDKYNETLGTFISVDKHGALDQARSVDAATRPLKKMACVPIAVKDNIDVRNTPTTNGVPLMTKVIPTIDSHIVKLIREHQAVIVGKANMAELSNSGLDSYNVLGGQCRNPFDPTRSCLGSSGGSGAAVAAGLVTVALGTDTEGSVIGPANANGVFGFRPGSNLITSNTYLQGVYPAFAKMDEVGYFARTMDDLLIMQEIVYGKYTRDQLAIADGMKGVKVQVMGNMYQDFNVTEISLLYKPDLDMKSLHDDAYKRMRAKGAEINVLNLELNSLKQKMFQIFPATQTKPTCSKSCMKQSLDWYYGSSSRFPNGPFNSTQSLFNAAGSTELPAGYISNLNYTILQATNDVCNSTSATSCKPYMDARQTITSVLTDLIGSADVLASPLSAKYVHKIGITPLLADQISLALNPYTGWPSITIPVGYSSGSHDGQKGIPNGVVLLTKPENTDKLLKFAYAYGKEYPTYETPSTFIPKIKSSSRLYLSIDIFFSSILLYLILN